MKPRLLDLFCGAGGAAMGYHRAGFDVVGVDIKPQPNYPFEFAKGDALDVLRDILGERGDDDELPQVLGDPDRSKDGVRQLVGCAVVSCGYFDVQVYEDLAGHDSPSVGVLVDSAKPAFPVKGFDVIHASPPCQAFTSLKVMHNARDHEDLLTPTRELLEQIGLPYVIENVPGAPIATLIRLCGTSFGLGVEAYDGWRELRRHRYFETTFPVLCPPCQHSGPTIGLYGDHARDRRRDNGNRGRDFPDKQKLELGRQAMGMPWAKKWREVTEAIPPAYTQYIGEQLLRVLSPTERETSEQTFSGAHSAVSTSPWRGAGRVAEDAALFSASPAAFPLVPEKNRPPDDAAALDATAREPVRDSHGGSMP